MGLIGLQFDLTDAASGTFGVQVSAGVYDIVAEFGGAAAFGPFPVTIEGTPVDSVQTSAGQTVQRVYRAPVGDGQLTLQASPAAVESLTLFPVNEPYGAQPAVPIKFPFSLTSPYYEAVVLQTIIDDALKLAAAADALDDAGAPIAGDLADPSIGGGNIWVQASGTGTLRVIRPDKTAPHGYTIEPAPQPPFALTEQPASAAPATA